MVLVLAILKKAKKGEEKGRKTRVQKKQRCGSMNQRNRIEERNSVKCRKT